MIVLLLQDFVVDSRVVVVYYSFEREWWGRYKRMVLSISANDRSWSRRRISSASALWRRVPSSPGLWCGVVIVLIEVSRVPAMVVEEEDEAWANKRDGSFCRVVLVAIPYRNGILHPTKIVEAVTMAAESINIRLNTFRRLVVVVVVVPCSCCSAAGCSCEDDNILPLFFSTLFPSFSSANPSNNSSDVDNNPILRRFLRWFRAEDD